MVKKTAGRGVGVTKALLRATAAEPRPESTDSTALLAEALEAVPVPEGVTVRGPGDAVPVLADSAMLHQVLTNLLRNAFEALGGNGTVTVDARADGGAAVISIADDGPGIEPSIQEILFEPFVTTRRGGREGVGLGLFLADRLVAAHGGRLTVDSKPGAGTTFTVVLPGSARDS